MRLVLLIFSVVLVADQASKAAIYHSFPPGYGLPVCRGFNLCHVQNFGMGYSIPTASAEIAVLIRICMTGVTLIMCYRGREIIAQSSLAKFGFGLALSGAVGNIVDYFVYGYVLDFIHLYFQSLNFWVFNIADAALWTTTAILVIFSWRQPKESEQPQTLKFRRRSKSTERNRRAA